VIVTIKQFHAMRSGRASLLFVPLMRASDWTVGRSIGLRRLVVREEQVRTSVPLCEGEGDLKSQVTIRLTDIGDPVEFSDIALRDALRAGFKTTSDLAQHWAQVYTSRERRGLMLPVGFKMVVDRPLFLTARSGSLSREDYTRDPLKAMRGEPEVMPLPRRAA
jgi:hypothetical protein